MWSFFVSMWEILVLSSSLTGASSARERNHLVFDVNCSCCHAYLFLLQPMVYSETYCTGVVGHVESYVCEAPLLSWC